MLAEQGHHRQVARSIVARDPAEMITMHAINSCFFRRGRNARDCQNASTWRPRSASASFFRQGRPGWILLSCKVATPLGGNQISYFTVKKYVAFRRTV